MCLQEGFVYFDTGKMEQILPKVLQFNTDLQKEEGNSNALNEVELKSLQRLADTIKNTSFYHSSSFEPEEYKVMAKLARWPPTKRFPGIVYWITSAISILVLLSVTTLLISS
jgi:phospholipase A-2-activating protein